MARRLVVTGMLMHRMVMAGWGAVVLRMLILRRRRSLLRVHAWPAWPAEEHGRGRKPLQRNRYQEQASQEHAESDHCGNSNDCCQCAGE